MYVFWYFSKDFDDDVYKKMKVLYGKNIIMIVTLVGISNNTKVCHH